MAEEITSTLGLNAEQMFQELARMQRQLSGYSSAVDLAASSMTNFNRIGAQTDLQAAKISSSLLQIERAVKNAGGEFRNLSPAAQNFANIIRTQENASKSLTSQLQEAAALARTLGQVSAARELDARAANLQAQATLKATLEEKANQRALEARLAKGRDPKNITTPQQGTLGAEFRAEGFLSEQKKVVASQQELREKLRQTEEVIRKTFRGDTVRQLGDDLEKTGKQGAEAGNKIFLSWESVVRIFTIQVLHRIVAQFSSALIEGTQAAKEFQISIAEIQTVSRNLDLSMDQLGARVLEVSNNLGAPLEIVTEGLYNALSNQVGEAAQAFDLLTTAQRFGIATITDTDSAVNLLSSVLNSYNLSVSEAETVSGKLFRTIELGRIRGEEFANTFGRVSVISAQLGIQLDEVLAAISSITVQGLKYNEAFTLITNVEQKLLQPTEELNKLFRDMGVASGEAAIQAFGFQGLLQQLSERTEGSSTDFAKLFNRIRAVRGAFSLTGAQGLKFTKVLEQIQKAGGQDLQEAFDTIFQTDAKQFEVELNKIRNLFTSAFGGSILSVLQTLFAAFGGGRETVIAFGVAAAAAAATFAIASTTILTSITAQTAGLTLLQGSLFLTGKAFVALGAFMATPLGLTIAVTTATLAAVAAYNQFAPSVKNVTDALREQTDVQIQSQLAIERERRRGADAQERQILAETQKFLFERQRLFQQDAEEAKRLQDTVFGSLADQIRDRISKLSSFAEGLAEKFNQARRSARELQFELEGIGNDLDQFNFERRLGGLEPQQQALLGIRRTEETLVALNAALQRGDFERAENLQRIASEAAKGALSAADESKSRGLIFRAEQTVRETFDAQAKIKQEQIKNNQQQIAQAGKLRDTEQARVTRLESLFEQFKQFKAIAENVTVDPKFDPVAAKKQLTLLSEQIKTELEGAAASVRAVAQLDINLNLDNIAGQIVEKFRDPITGVRIDLTPLIDINLDAIVNKLNTQAASLTPIQLRGLEQLGLSIDFRGVTRAQEGVVQLRQQLDAAVKSTNDLTLAQGELEKQGITANQQAANLAANINAIASRGTALNAVFGDRVNIFTNVLRRFSLIPQITQQTPLSKEVVDNVVSFQKALASGDATNAQRSINNILETANALRDSFPNLAKQADTLVGELQKLQRQAADIELTSNAATQLTPLEEKIRSIQGLFTTTNTEASSLGTNVQTGVNQASAANKQFSDEITRHIELLKQRNELARGLSGGTTNVAPARAFGGYVFDAGVLNRAFGGFTRGTDTLLTALTRGESVNDVAATRRFFPQIQAMNAGVQPVFRESGGIVNNVGDIHVTVNEAKNGRVTGREVTRALNRELRKKTSNLKGL